MATTTTLCSHNSTSPCRMDRSHPRAISALAPCKSPTVVSTAPLGTSCPVSRMFTTARTQGYIHASPTCRRPHLAQCDLSTYRCPRLRTYPCPCLPAAGDNPNPPRGMLVPYTRRYTSVCMYIAVCIPSKIKHYSQHHVSATANGATVVGAHKPVATAATDAMPLCSPAKVGGQHGDNTLDACTFSPKHKHTLNLKPDLALPCLDSSGLVPRTNSLSGPAQPRSTQFALQRCTRSKQI